MDIDVLENILNLFDQCQSQGKPLKINIDQDLLKILPFPRQFIISLLSEPSASAFSYLSNDENTLYFKNNLYLCSIDQNRCGSCQSSSCEQLHLCKNYLLNKNCLKCSYSHSLSTNHNELILNKFNFSSQDKHLLEFISHINKLSSSKTSNIIVQSLNNKNISDQLIDLWLGQHKSLLNDKKMINQTTVELIFDDDEVASMMEEMIIKHHSNTAVIKKDFRQDKELDREVELTNEKLPSESPVNISFGRGRGRQQFNQISSSPNGFSRRLGSNDQSSIQTNEKKFSFSHRLQPTTKSSTDNSLNSTPEIISTKNEQKQNPISPSNEDSISSESPSKSRFVLRGYQTKTKTTINYIYTKPFNDEQLCYLLGPGKEHLEYEILSCLPSGYCRVMNNQQGNEIEKRLYSILPKKLNIELVQINHDLSLLICSSAAEFIFQQNQNHYAIITEPMKVQLNIEIINAPTIDRRQSSSKDHSQQPSDRKFHINPTDSTIDIMCGDICEIPVDMMICISTSNNLRESVLRRAGQTIATQFNERYRPTDALLLDGGQTSAKKILFVPWQTEIEETGITKTQQSLSDLVKWSIEQAYQRKLKSVSFPPIGTGQLGLDPGFVCEAMISAASERLHQYKMDVIFVVYPTKRDDENDAEDEDECYQVFRIYLDSLCEQVKLSTPTINNERNTSRSFESKKQTIRRDVQSKRLLTLSDTSNVSQDHNSLIKSLEKLMYEKTYDLSFIESSLINEVDLLIDICLKYNVYPRIDYIREEIIVRGDRESCIQCFFNLRQDKNVFQYSYVLTEDGHKSDEILFNSFISLKIDQAFAIGESNIYVEDDDRMVYQIDLNKLQVQINKNKQSAFLVKKQLNNKIEIPSSWSSSSLLIRTNQIKPSLYRTLDCVRAFEETMSTSDWQIERIDSIENYPFYIHFMNKSRKERTKLYFHGCSYSSVQSIIHYGLHSTNVSNYGSKFENPSNGSICLTRDVLNSHLYGTRRSTDGKHYLFAIELATNDNSNNDFVLLSNKDANLALPTHLIVYQRRN